jgi:hypothetical protein
LRSRSRRLSHRIAKLKICPEHLSADPEPSELYGERRITTFANRRFVPEDNHMKARQAGKHIAPTPNTLSVNCVRKVDQHAHLNRRQLLKLGFFGVLFSGIASRLLGEKAWARNEAKKGLTPAAPVLLDPTDPQAAALSYDAESPKKGQTCSNCQLYTGTEGEEQGPCAIFSYRVAPQGGQIIVSADGWCRAWAARQSV